jgi:hypothetical protein
MSRPSRPTAPSARGASFALASLVAACTALCPAAAAAAPAKEADEVPKPVQLRTGWEIRDVSAAPAQPQPKPPEEGQPSAVGASTDLLRSRASQAPSDWRPARVPGVFQGRARAAFFGGSVKLYRLRFLAPVAKGFDWVLRFEQVRRRATVSLNGRRLGVRVDPYTPFELPARGLRPGKINTLEVLVDSRKDPRLPEGWWNWGGITRPVQLLPIGKATVRDLGLMSDVTCRGPALRCRASLLVDGVLDKLPEAKPPRKEKKTSRKRAAPQRPPQPELTIRLKPPGARAIEKTFEIRGSRKGRRRVSLEMPVPAPKLWSPERPQLYDARVTLTYDGRTTQLERRRIGLRSIEVKRGLLYLNNRPVNLRGASIHEDFPGHGAATTGQDMDTVVRELKELGANVTRSHYVLSEGLLQRLDRAGIMVYNQAPVWQRDHRANLLGNEIDRARAVAQVERTVKAARNHPSVIVNSVGNELTFKPDQLGTTKQFLLDAAAAAREADPTVPIAVDIKTRPYLEEQFTYGAFDLIGINQYFGWYPWVEDFRLLEPFLSQMRDHYPDKALVMTEFGAEGRPDMAGSAAGVKGSYAFQAAHVARTIDLVDRLPFMSGAIHWTLREFEIFPGWRGGAVEGGGPNDNIRHHKGVLTYDGRRKPAWNALRERYARTPLYR